MTRTFRLNVDRADRHARLARLFTRARDEARAAYYSTREAHAIYQAEARAVRRARLAEDMRGAITRDYAPSYYHDGPEPCGEPAQWTNPDWTISERDRERNYR